MTTALFLRPPASGATVAEWLELAGNGSLLASGQLHWPTDLAQLASQAQGKTLTVLLPVSQALVSRVQVPAKQRKHLAQVLPYLLEEQLAGNIDDLHVVAGASLGDDELQVIAVEHAQLRALLATLAVHGLRADEVCIDALCLPANEQPVLLPLHQDALLRLADGTAQLLPVADLNAVLPLLLGDNELKLYCADSGFTIAHPHQRDDIDQALALLARSAQRGAVSLLQGPYAKQTAWQGHWRQWRKVALLAAVALVAQYAYAIGDWLLMKQQLSRYDGAIRSSFAQAFPDQADTPYPINSMNGYLKQLGSAGTGAFTGVLAEIAPVLQQSDGISLRGLGYEASSGELRLDLSARDLPALNQLDSRLQQLGFHTDMGQASASSGGYSSRMVLSRGGEQKGKRR